MAGLREELDRARRQASTVRDPMETYGSAELMPMDSIGAYYTRLANDERLGGAVKAFAKAISWAHATPQCRRAMLQAALDSLSAGIETCIGTTSGV